jgi:hypothetical protein
MCLPTNYVVCVSYSEHTADVQESIRAVGEERRENVFSIPPLFLPGGMFLVILEEVT